MKQLRIVDKRLRRWKFVASSTSILTALMALILLTIAIMALVRNGKDDSADSNDSGEFCTWDNCPKWSTKEGIINVHLICHSHDDLGWLKTVDDYYTGANGLTYSVGVQYILDTVVDELLKDSSRRFSYAETGFLTRWLEDKSPERVELLRKLAVEKGQLEFIGGGWTQPDEGTTHYYDLLDQYTLGLGKLAKKFGKCGRPKVAWQIDPFGHSKEHANLVSLMGYEALFFARMHYLELKLRNENKTLEMLWSTQQSVKFVPEPVMVPDNRTIFTGGFHRGTYTQPPGFCFDVNCKDEPIIDDPNLEGFNVHTKVNDFLEGIKEQANMQMHNHLMVPMGEDFSYSSAVHWFTNIDKLIKAANNKTNETGVHLFYSTPACYAKAVMNSGLELPRKDDDFFPYATGEHSYWTGYFSSKPAFKGMVRKSSAFLQLVRAFDAVSAAPLSSPSNSTSKNDDHLQKIEKFERAQALTTHHDSITGTSKEAVTQNYIYRLTKGMEAGMEVLGRSLSKLASKNYEHKNEFPLMRMCNRINESRCPESTNNDKFIVTVFNGNGRNFSGLIRIPVNRTNAIVFDGNGQNVNSEIVPTFVATGQIPNTIAPARNELMFNAHIPAIGFNTYFVSTAEGATKRNNRRSERAAAKQNSAKAAESENTQAGRQISNKFIKLTFNREGLIEFFEDLERKNKLNFTQKFMYYIGANASDGQASGAYVFRPKQKKSAIEIKEKIELNFIRNDLVQEARQTIGPWLSQVVRLFPDKPYVEFEYLVGPLPRDDNDLTSREIITRYSLPSLKSNGVFWTDSNGRQMIQRNRNHNNWFQFEGDSEPISANYYPVYNKIIMEDKDNHMTVMTDRTHGATSLREGELEIMLQRRCFWDDGYGVDEPLDEPGEDGRGLAVRGRHWLHISASPSTVHRQIAMAMFHQPVIAFSKWENGGRWEEYTQKFHTNFSGLTFELPANVNLLTLKRVGPKTILLRLEHIYQQGEDKEYSNPISVDLKNLLTGITLDKVSELSLAGNAFVEELKEFKIRLEPFQIRTFIVTVKI